MAALLQSAADAARGPGLSSDSHTRVSDPSMNNADLLDPPEMTEMSPMLARALMFENLSQSAQMKVQLQRVRSLYQRHDTDTGSSEVQIAAMSERVTHLTNHLRVNRKDKSALRGLQLVLAKRKKLLKYLHRTDRDLYYDTIEKCKIKDTAFSQDKYKK